jgi:hypothetical protein
LYGPDGGKFAPYVELAQQAANLAKRAEQLETRLPSLGINPEA